MSGAQGALPQDSRTATVYESVEGGENKTRTDIRSREDQGGLEIDKLQDKVKDAAGEGGPVFGVAAVDAERRGDTGKTDIGVTGTGA